MNKLNLWARFMIRFLLALQNFLFWLQAELPRHSLFFIWYTFAIFVFLICFSMPWWAAFPIALVFAFVIDRDNDYPHYRG